MLRQELHELLESLLTVDDDGRFQIQDARHSASERLPRRQLSLYRSARSRNTTADQRMQPAGHERDWREHLGQFLVADLQGSAIGWNDHCVSPVHRRAL